MDYSIIVPCHNVEKEIKNLLISFHMLNLENIEYEIIFVLDKCTDNTLGMINLFMKDMNYKVIHSFAGAPGLARNLGLNIANGKYIWFIDSDDWIINPEVLQQVKHFFIENNEDMIQIEFVSNFFKIKHFSMVWQYIFTYDLIKDVRFDEKQNHEDFDFMKKIFTEYRRKKELLYLSVPTYFYNYNRPGSQTTKLRGKEEKEKKELNKEIQ